MYRKLPVCNILMNSYAHKILNPKPNTSPGTDINISGHHGNTVKRGLTVITSLLFSMSELMYADEIDGPNKAGGRVIRRNDVTDPC